MNNEIQKNKLQILGKLFATLTHEIRNPLSVLKMNLDMLPDLEDGKQKDEIDEIIYTSNEAVRRIERIISQTMDFLRTNENSFEYSSINEIIQETLDFIFPKARKEGIQIFPFLDDNLPKIKVIKNQIVQVLINLLTNSLEASEKGQVIQIKSFFDTKKKKVVLQVIDEGIGIKNEHQEVILNEFFTTKESGNGIGLFVCKEIIKNHKGKLRFESEYKKGTTFFISFSNYKV